LIHTLEAAHPQGGVTAIRFGMLPAIALGKSSQRGLSIARDCVGGQGQRLVLVTGGLRCVKVR
jgi:hypothetical protein